MGVWAGKDSEGKQWVVEEMEKQGNARRIRGHKHDTRPRVRWAGCEVWWIPERSQESH